jgi:hypothetical protein
MQHTRLMLILVLAVWIGSLDRAQAIHAPNPTPSPTPQPCSFGCPSYINPNSEDEGFFNSCYLDESNYATESAADCALDARSAYNRPLTELELCLTCEKPAWDSFCQALLDSCGYVVAR